MDRFIKMVDQFRVYAVKFLITKGKRNRNSFRKKKKSCTQKNIENIKRITYSAQRINCNIYCEEKCLAEKQETKAYFSPILEATNADKGKENADERPEKIENKKIIKKK